LGGGLRIPDVDGWGEGERGPLLVGGFFTIFFGGGRAFFGGGRAFFGGGRAFFGGGRAFFGRGGAFFVGGALFVSGVFFLGGGGGVLSGILNSVS